MSAAGMDTDLREGSRSLVVSGVPDVLPVSRMVDKLTIHFQSRRRSRGGDVEEVRYPTNMDGVAFVTFHQAGDAARAAAKRRHVLRDDEFPDEYLLTVFPFTRDVFFYVPSASLDLSVFGSDPAPLIRSLRSAHRSIRFRRVPEQSGATIEGPFAAVQLLREDLIHRARWLQLTAQTAAVQQEERVNSPRGSDCRTQNDSWKVSAGNSEDRKEQVKIISAKQPGPAPETRSRLDQSDRSLQSGLPGDRDEQSVWVDSYALRYLEEFHRPSLDRCLRGFSVRRDGAELTRIIWTERKASAAARRPLEDLKSLFERWQSELRVHQISCDRKQKQKLIEICDDVKYLFRDVLYIPEDSCVKVIGPSVPNHLFCEWVEERLKDSGRALL